jgi:hypothetical protein
MIKKQNEFKMKFGLFLISLFYFFKAEKILKYEYCNINESKTIYYIIKDLQEHFSLNKYLMMNNDRERCMILSEELNFLNYSEKYFNLDFLNRNSYNQFKCSECDKKFKSKSLLHIHFKLFHTDSQNPGNVCPASFCRFFNCERYKSYYQIPYPDNSRDSLIYNKPGKENIQECNPELVGFYRKSCMKMVEGCFENDFSYFEFYKNFCMKIECKTGKEEDSSRNYKQQGSLSNVEELSKDFDYWHVMEVVFMYIISIFAFIYILIVWVSHYS